ncbi:MAG TPA: DUF3417 domain-containing protein, partial [Gaiellaceae bacterium]|nr:DUF3417 domain-containing protein [Gaiellaceae bacterium]
MGDLGAAAAALSDALSAIAHDFAFTWHPEARALFERLDPELWRQTERNPAAVVAGLTPEAL